MKVLYIRCKACTYKLNPSTEKLCLYCREKLPAYDPKVSPLFTKGYMPVTFYGKIRKLFREVYKEKGINITYSKGSRGTQADIELLVDHYLSASFFRHIELCNGYVYWMNNYGGHAKITVRQRNNR